jgi:hypothetical protein
VAVALGVIWIGDQFAGGGGDTTPVASISTTGPGATVAGGQPTQSPATSVAAATGSPSGSPTVGGPAKFRAGDVAVVTGTGDCLNVRVAPGTTNDAIICLKDGSEVTVIRGPELNGNLRWWNVKTASGEGWAAEDYLVKKP